MKKVLKIIWSIVILAVAVWNVHILYKYGGPKKVIDLDQSIVVCDNGKSFAMNKYGSSNARLEFQYECSGLYDEISLDNFKLNFGENWDYKDHYSTVQCKNKDLSFEASRPENFSILYYRYQCSEYNDILSFGEYEAHFNNYERSLQQKEVEGHAKQYTYTALAIIVLFLFWYFATFKKIDELPAYLKLFVIVGNIATVGFIIYALTGIIAAIIIAASGDL